MPSEKIEKNAWIIWRGVACIGLGGLIVVVSFLWSRSFDVFLFWIVVSFAILVTMSRPAPLSYRATECVAWTACGVGLILLVDAGWAKRSLDIGGLMTFVLSFAMAYGSKRAWNDWHECLERQTAVKRFVETQLIGGGAEKKKES